MKGLVVEACLRLRAAISAHSASKGSPPPLGADLVAPGAMPVEPRDMALVWSGGARRGVLELLGAAPVACVVRLPSHCSGFGRFLTFGTAGWI